MADEDLERTLLGLERRGWDSLCDSTGGRFYGALMTEDAVMVLANGLVLDRAAVVDSLAKAPPWSTYALTDARVIRTGSDGAALVYVGTARRAGDDRPFTAVMSSCYRRHDGTWRLALYQQTPLPLAD